MENDDRDVWAQVLRGDARAFGVIWDRHHIRVFRHLRSTGLDRADAEDLTAATFLELWRRRASTRFVDGSLLPWLIVTARNVARNASRSRRRYERLLSSLPAPEPATDPAERHEVDDRSADIRSALAAASRTDADLVSMTALEGFTVREAASALGLSESAAKMRLSRFRHRVRRLSETRPTPEGGT
ncbi:RNA polymerase sigma factor [Homoserinibacter sp. GY 40078]|uniref:RNA polymerase sigma factor n=1 Tax=Homoserinibacter sp. GY 40078 TaxID=2603275 RepID=UPI0016500F90|nr:RNA polymerase sigma factor [Homoserinibacter sp. GY 40078]